MSLTSYRAAPPRDKLHTSRPRSAGRLRQFRGKIRRAGQCPRVARLCSNAERQWEGRGTEHFVNLARNDGKNALERAPKPQKLKRKKAAAGREHRGGFCFRRAAPKAKRPPFRAAVFLKNIVLRRSVLGRPGSDLLFQVLRLSTIGAGEFYGRVRDGIGYRPPAKTTRPAKDE